MIRISILARVTDGLLLCEYYKTQDKSFKKAKR